MIKYLKVLFVLFLFIICYCSPAFALNTDEKIKIVIMDFTGKEVPKHVPIVITDLIRGDIVNSKLFIVLDRVQIDSILKEQGLQMIRCKDQDCTVEMGRVLSAKKMLVGDVSMLGKNYIITARLIDIAKGEVDFAVKEKAAPEDSLDDPAFNISQKIIDLISRETGMASSMVRPVKKEMKNIEKGRDYEILLPSGIRLSYMLAMPLTSPYKDYYPLLHGGEISYWYFFNYYISLKVGGSFTINTYKNPEIYSFLNSYHIGVDFGIPLVGFIYPYIGLSLKGIWGYESVNSRFHDVGGLGIDGSIGIAFTVVQFFGFYAEYVIGWGIAFDKVYTDLSAHSVKAGIYLRF